MVIRSRWLTCMGQSLAISGKEWGESKHTFVWTGHIHHKNQEEYGGAIFESFNILAPPDAWHAASGYSSSRSMSCIVLHQEFGEEGRLKVNIKGCRMSAFDDQYGGNHYKHMVIQPLEYGLANNLGICEHAVVKYVSRWRSKVGVEDLQKS